VYDHFFCLFFISLTAHQLFLSLWCLICGPFHLHLLVCYSPHASTFVPCMLPASAIHQIHCHSFIQFCFSCAFLLFSVYPILLSFYSCNYLLGHYNEQVLLLCGMLCTLT
jgi:hypothetical protein